MGIKIMKEVKEGGEGVKVEGSKIQNNYSSKKSFFLSKLF